MLEMIGSDLRPQIGKIQIPLLTISAVSNDGGPEMAANIRAVVRDEFKGASPSVKLVTFEDSRHFIMDDRPADLDQAIATFLAGGKVDDVVTKKAAPAQVAPVQVTPAPATSEAHRE
jgi:pimeloyl-ACP methyl ester carboxylesterase